MRWSGHRSAATIALGFISLTIPRGAHNQPPQAIGNPAAELRIPFSRVATIRELTDGRLLVVDERENSLSLIDFVSNTAKPVGRTGAGPGEYGYPGRLVALPGDSSLLHDPPNGRYLIIKPDGTPGETIRIDQAAFRTLGARGSIPRGTDARGAIYFEGAPFRGNRAGGPAAFDSTPVMRYDRRTARLDTITWVQLAMRDVRITRGSDGGVSVAVGTQAYSVRDDWAPLAAGGVAVARVRDYHVDWYPSIGPRASGAPVRFTAVAVTDADKEAWRAERRSRIAPRTSGDIPATVPDPEWPATMPPFLYWATFSRPNGELWVLRSHRASDNPVYDVFTAPGRLTRRIALPARTRLVGFGNGTVYLVRRDDDDLEHLQRYVLR